MTGSRATPVYGRIVAQESDLLEAWAAGDGSAGQALLTRHFDRLFRFFELSAPGLAEDLVQETMLAALEGRARFRGESGFGTFLMGIARNKVLMHWRTRARRPDAVEIGSLSLEALGASATSIIAHKDAEQRLLQALRTIPLADQLLLQMHYWDGLTGPQLAAALDRPEGTVRSRLRSAKAKLRALLDDARPVREGQSGFDAWVAGLRETLEAPEGPG